MWWLEKYFTTQLQKLGVDLQLRVHVTPELITEVAPEVLIIATGARPAIPEITGVEGRNVVTEHALLWHALIKDTTSYVRVKDILASGAGSR